MDIFKSQRKNYFLIFSIVGGAATAMQYLILYCLVTITTFQPTPASNIGFIASSTFNYLATRKYTLQPNSGHKQAFVKFYI
jgi:putative flippase GtrA